jgi:potassium-dependent mechanosensitive channel
VYRILRIVALTLLAFTTSAAGSDDPAPDASAKPQPSITPIPLTQASVEAQSTHAALEQIDADESRDQTSVDAIAHTFADLRNEIDPRIADDTRLLSNNSTIESLYRVRLTWKSFAQTASVLAKDLTQYATNVEDRLKRIASLDAVWRTTLTAAKETHYPPQVLEQLQNLIDTIGSARDISKSHQGRVLTLLSEVSEEQSRVQSTLSAIEEAEQQTLSRLFEKDSPAIWSVGPELATELANRGDASLSAQLESSNAYTKRLPVAMLIHLLFVLLMAGALYWVRRRVSSAAKEKPNLQRALPILDLPVSTAFALSILGVSAIYAQAPRLIQSLVGIVILYPTILFLRRLILRSAYPIINALVVLYFVGLVRLMTAALPTLSRVIFLIQLLGAIGLLVWVLLRWRMPPEAVATHRRVQFTIRLTARIGLLILSVAFLACALGYTNLGYVLGLLYMRGIYVAGLLFAIVRIIEGLIAIALQVRPLGSLRVVNLHRAMLQKRASNVVAFFALLFWLNLVLNFLGLRDPFLSATQAVLNAKLAFGSIDITLGQILAFVLTVWASFLISKFLRFLLEEDVYQRVHLAHGIPYAISTMSHYTILLIGFLVALGALGIDLTKVTILAGAFSVGIGFGLQNVINNFVSGLILLFERPIKVGDVIEVGGNVGEVRRIGIRASVLRTADGSEVIVPNGSLISNQVTNWTLSDRKRAVEVSVNVAANADPVKVVNLLKSTAAAHEGVAKDPSPDAFVTNLSPSAVTFQLRFWTDQHQQWVTLRSELLLAVSEALAREKIAIA